MNYEINNKNTQIPQIGSNVYKYGTRSYSRPQGQDTITSLLQDDPLAGGAGAGDTARPPRHACHALQVQQVMYCLLCIKMYIKYEYVYKMTSLLSDLKYTFLKVNFKK